MTNSCQSVAIISVVCVAMLAALMAAAVLLLQRPSRQFASSFSYFVSGCEQLGLVSISFEQFSSVFVLAQFGCNYPGEHRTQKFK